MVETVKVEKISYAGLNYSANYSVNRSMIGILVLRPIEL